MALLPTLLGCAGVPSELSRPNRIALGPDGQVFVSDFHHDRIVVFDAHGSFVRAFGRQGIEEGDLWRVTAMTFADDGALVVANRRPETDVENSPIRLELKRFVDGEEVGRTMLDGRTLQTEGWIDAVAQAPRGNWVIADSTHGELVEVDVEGRRVGQFGGMPRPDASPSALRRDGDSMWIIEQHRHRMTRLAPGEDTPTLELKDDGHGPPRFPSALGVCGEAWIAVADFGNHRVQRYGHPLSDRAGEWLGEFTPVPAAADRPVQLMDLAVTPDCERLYLVDSKGDRVLVTDPDGAILQVLSSW